MDSWKAIQVHFLEMDKVNQFCKIYHKSLLANQNLVKTIELKIINIILVIQNKILDLEGPKFHI